MAAENRRQTAVVAQQLHKQPERFSFFQVVRLLRLLASFDSQDTNGDFLIRALRIRPKLSFGFPATDIASLRDLGPDSVQAWEIVTNFMGLYGSSSPLPNHYTEDLFDEEREDGNVTREFLDVLSGPFYRLFFECWSKYRLDVRINEELSREVLNRLACLAGFDKQTFADVDRDFPELLRYLGLFLQQPRSLMGLEALLATALSFDSLRVESCVLRNVLLPEESRCRLGEANHQLGNDCCIGDQIQDRMGKIRIRVTVDRLDEFYGLLPRGALFGKLYKILELYLVEPLECDLVVTIAAELIESPQLGMQDWCCLGRDTWLFSSKKLLGQTSITIHCR